MEGASGGPGGDPAWSGPSKGREELVEMKRRLLQVSASNPSSRAHRRGPRRSVSLFSLSSSLA
jgi:hypothetical protein